MSGSLSATKIKSISPAARASSSFLLVQERRNQKEGHPGLRALRTSMRCGCACDDGIFRRHIRVPTKNGARPVRRPAGLTAATRRCAGAPNSGGHPARVVTRASHSNTLCCPSDATSSLVVSLMQNRVQRAAEISKAIQEILINDWDPIGVRDDPECPRDEYDSYIGEIYASLARNEPADFIARHLCLIESQRMGLGALDESARMAVALKLKALDVSLQG